MDKAGTVFGILLILLLAWFIARREKCKRKVRMMNEREKISLLADLTRPFGFVYEPSGDIFVSVRDAWQRREGYEKLFDRLSSKFNMVIDAFPVYFDYRGKTWMIEFWKGQYGINTGAEVGIYHANRLVPKNQREKIHYNAVSDEEMPLISVCLQKKSQILFCKKEYHWWLAAFRMGMFSQPEDLSMQATVTFHDTEAARAFCQGLNEAGLAKNGYRMRGRRVSVWISDSCPHFGMEKRHRSMVQALNHFYCCAYRLVTLPFTDTADRMLFLYEQLPWCFRHMMRLHSFGRKARVKR